MRTFREIYTSTVSIIFASFAFLLPWQTAWILREPFVDGEKWQYGTISMRLSIVLLSIWILLAVMQKHRIRMMLHQHTTKYAILLFTFSVWTGFSVLWSEDMYLAVSSSVLFLLGITCFLLVSPWEKRIFFTVFLLSMTVQSCFGLWQFLMQNTYFSSSILGISSHEAWLGGSSVIEQSGRWIRAYGGFQHPNMFGGFLAIALLIGIQKYTDAQSPKKKWFLLAVLSVLFSALIFTFSRNAWIGLVAGETIFIFYSLKTQSVRIFFQKIAPVLLLAVGISTVFFATYNTLFFVRSGIEETRLEKKSLSDRISYIHESASIIRSHVWIGTGIGNYTGALRKKNPEQPIWQQQPVHNVPLLLWAETGIVGVFVFFSGIFFLLQFVIKHSSSPQKTILFSCLTAIGWMALFDHWLWTSASGTLLFFILLSIEVQNSKHKIKEGR